jgi:signal transduction histidine kinase
LVIAVLLLALLAIQDRWINRFGALSQQRMEQYLAVAMANAGEAFDLAYAASLQRAQLQARASDTAASWISELTYDSTADRIAMSVRAPQAGDESLILLARDVIRQRDGSPPVTITVLADSTHLRTILLPRLTSSIAAKAGLVPLLALYRETTPGEGIFLGPPGPTPRERPDVSVKLFALSVEANRGIFMLLNQEVAASDSSHDSSTTASPPLAWRSDAPKVFTEGNADQWLLVAWHEAGSVERAVANLVWRNRLSGLAILLLLGGSVWYLVHAAQVRERDATDRVTMLAGISHELRTPLAVIRSAADNLGDGTVRGEVVVAEYGTMIARESDRLLRTVNGALSLAKAEDVSFTASPGTVPLTALRASTLDRLPEAHRVVWEPSAEVDVDVSGELLSLTILLRNLLANALAYSPATSHVVVVTEIRDHSVRLDILDEGPGIPETELAVVLEPFRRGSAGQRSGHSGAGLGLALAARIARAHGGRLVLANRPDGGLCAEVTIRRSTA